MMAAAWRGQGHWLAIGSSPARPSRDDGVKGRVGNRLARPGTATIAAQHPAQQALSRNMTGRETPAGDAARPLPAQDASREECSRPRVAIEARGKVPPGSRMGSEATAMDRQPDPGPAQEKRSRFDGRYCVSPARIGRTALRPDDGRSASNGTPLKLAQRKMRKPTEQEIEAAKTPNGGWTRETLSAWGVPWPPSKGWKAKLLNDGTDWNDELRNHA